MKFRFRYGLVGNLIFFGGTAACLGYLGYLVFISANSKMTKGTFDEIINKDPKQINKL